MMPRHPAGPNEKTGTAEAPVVRRGAAELVRLLEEETFDLRETDLAGFRAWLDRHLDHWRRDPIFRERVAIRDRRRDHPELRTAEREHRHAARLDADSEVFSQLRRLERQLAGVEKAITGLTTAVSAAASEKRRSLAAKLKAFRSQRRALVIERSALTRSSPERLALRRAEKKLQRLRQATGLQDAEDRLARMLLERGRRGGHAGISFERACSSIVAAELLPEVIRHSSSRGTVHVLHGVTLGAAGVEFDILVVHRPVHREEVEVLAAVEAKRNINDLEHGFRHRQADLAWLTDGSGSADPADYRTATFPTGHFDRRVLHREAGEDFVFGPDSFRRFSRDSATGLFLERLYFIMLAGPVWGLSSAALSSLSHRVATDDRLDLASGSSLRALLAWCRTLARPFETPDLLRLLARDRRTARRVLIVNR